MKRTWNWCYSLFTGLLVVSGVACAPSSDTAPAPSSTETEDDSDESSSRSLDLEREIDGLDEASPEAADGPARVRSA